MFKIKEDGCTTYLCLKSLTEAGHKSEHLIVYDIYEEIVKRNKTIATFLHVA